MVVRTASHDKLSRMVGDVRQLTEPFTLPVQQRARGARTRWYAVDHPALLDQLRAAVAPGSTARGPERRRIPDSRPPVRLDESDQLAHIYTGIAYWHARLNLPSPAPDADWQKQALQQLLGAATSLAPSIADDLADAVHDWWAKAAVAAGWYPSELPT